MKDLKLKYLFSTAMLFISSLAFSQNQRITEAEIVRAANAVPICVGAEIGDIIRGYSNILIKPYVSDLGVLSITAYLEPHMEFLFSFNNRNICTVGLLMPRNNDISRALVRYYNNSGDYYTLDDRISWRYYNRQLNKYYLVQALAEQNKPAYFMFTIL